MLWTSAGSIAYSYAEEKQKARYVTGQWVFCAAGSSIASITMLGINLHQTHSHAHVPQCIYWVIFGLQLVSFPIAVLCLVRPSEVVRTGGNGIAKDYNTTWLSELKSYKNTFLSRKVACLLPAMLTGEIALALQSSLNGFFFNIRTRCLNNFLFSSSQIPASLIIAWCLDTTRVFQNRKHRAFLTIIIVCCISLGVSGGQMVWVSKNKVHRKVSRPSTDWNDEAYKVPCALFILYGVVYG